MLALLRFSRSTLEPKKLRNCFRRLIPHRHHPGSAMIPASTIVDDCNRLEGVQGHQGTQQETARPVRISQEFFSKRRTPPGSFLILTRALEFLRTVDSLTSPKEHVSKNIPAPQVSVSEKIERFLSFFSPSPLSHNMLKPTPASARSAIYRPPTWVNCWFLVSSPLSFSHLKNKTNAFLGSRSRRFW